MALTRLPNAYGLYVNIDDVSLKIFDDMRALEAERHIDVAVKYNGVVKEFTLDEFLRLLGFEKEH